MAKFLAPGVFGAQEALFAWCLIFILWWLGVGGYYLWVAYKNDADSFALSQSTVKKQNKHPKVCAPRAKTGFIDVRCPRPDLI